MQRAVAILTGLDTHLDHLGVLSHILEIPLIVTEERIFDLAKKFYPELHVSLMGLNDLSLHYLAEHFDVIFETGKFWAADLSSSLELLYGKKMRFIFCPHGNSDKGHSIHEKVGQDVSLFYGEHLFDLLKRNGSLENIQKTVRTGNYRLPYYLERKTFYDDLAQREIFSKFDTPKPIALYAPTWSNKENPSSFFSATTAIIEQLHEDFNLLIKLHPFLTEHHPAHAYSLICRYENHPSVIFLTDFPPIYPLLDKSAFYLGDFSSIGYDFLSYDKPLFFLCEKNMSQVLDKCGRNILAQELPHLKGVIFSHLHSDPYSAIRRATYAYAFGNEKSAKSLRTDIFNALK